jgi:23S rRNA pseudoU1915 N3-methylase RlmH
MDIYQKAESGFYSPSSLPSTVSFEGYMKEFEKEIKSQILELDNIPLTVTDRNQKTKEFREILKQKRKELTLRELTSKGQTLNGQISERLTSEEPTLKKLNFIGQT